MDEGDDDDDDKEASSSYCGVVVINGSVEISSVLCSFSPLCVCGFNPFLRILIGFCGAYA